ncbi:unnamed protein product [Sphagnum jensenii]|uniref:NADP-dependent oxidoreductase domain-containing protein n=1 Tax=Sphagnum jensenii TaxID=128206 RepID=A0ABP0WGK3_9BRYO
MASAESGILPTVPRVKLGPEGLEVSALGLGCMGMSGAFHGPSKPDAEMIELIRYAVDCGVTFLDTAEFYGPHTNEILIGKAIKGIREKVQIATKFGGIFGKDRTVTIRGDPEWVRTTCEGSLKRLDVDYIDLYTLARIDSKVPIEITVGAMKELVEEGKVKHLGLSEASASEIRRAHAVHPITAVQMEWSLWTRDLEEDVVPTCRELGIAIVPYSPLGKGFFAGSKLTGAQEGDMRGVVSPKFSAENIEKNNVLRERVVAIAEKKKCSLNQLALAWVMHKGKDVVPIPGTTKRANLESNIGSVAISLTKEEIAEIEAAVPANEVAGERLNERLMKLTWLHAVSPPLSAWMG